MLSYILMKNFFLFVDLRLQRLPRLSLASALALLSIVIRFPRRLLWSFRLPSDCLDVSLGAKRTLFAFFLLAAFVPRSALARSGRSSRLRLAFGLKRRTRSSTSNSFVFLRPKPALRYFAHRSMLLTKADIEGLSLRSAWSFVLHYFTSPRFARLGLSSCTILQALASLGLSFALHYFTSPRFARLGLSPCTILQALASLGLVFRLALFYKLSLRSACSN